MAEKRSIRRYRVKEGWIFNLEAMHDKLWCIGNDLDEGILTGPVEILGLKEINCSSDIRVLIDEAYELECAAKGRGLTGEQYKRVKEMVEWRVIIIKEKDFLLGGTVHGYIQCGKDRS